MADFQRGFNIGVFRAEMMDRGLANPNLFVAEFAIPRGLLGHKNYQYNVDTVRTLEYWIEGASLPGLQLQTYQAQRYGYGTIEQRVVLPGFIDIGFDIIFDAESANYDFFRDWMNMAVNKDFSQGPNGVLNKITDAQAYPAELAFRENYVADTSIYLYDKLGNVIKKITLRDSFPKSLGEIRLAWQENNQFMRLPISMAFTDWFESPFDGEGPNIPAGANPLK